eukprot:SAG31_NODE_487_length_14980_cov_9.526376_19_plen_69_part_00
MNDSRFVQVVCIPERCTGFFDAVDATLTGAQVETAESSSSASSLGVSADQMGWEGVTNHFASLRRFTD